MKKKKKKYSEPCILFMVVLPLCLMLSCVVHVSAETNDIYADMSGVVDQLQDSIRCFK